ncbi:hypothetical protein FACS1894133_6270 [Clostridia bacterium]|nr:hypothetical protein FACS1894133_6270 [Clostridia bacterium]
MKNMKIKAKLTVGFGVVIAFMVIVALLVGIMNTMSLGRVQQVVAAVNVSDEAYLVRGDFLSAAVVGRAITTAYSDKDYTQFTPLIETAANTAAEFKTMVASDNNFSEYVSAADTVIQSIAEYKTVMDSISTTYHASQTEKNTAVDLGSKMSGYFTAINGSTKNLILSSLTSGEADLVSSINARLNIITQIDEAYTQLLTVRANGSSVFAKFDSDTIDAQKKTIDTASDAVSAALNNALKLSKSPENIKAINDALEASTTYSTSIDAYIAKMEEINGISEKAVAARLEVINSIQHLADQLSDATDANTTTAITLSTVTLVAVLVVVVVTIIVSVIMMQVLTHGIVPPVEYISHVLSAIGDEGRVQFSDAEWAEQKHHAESRDETGVAATALGKVAQRLGRVGSLVQSVSEGDLTIQPRSLGSVDLLGNSLIAMVDNLNAMFGDINTATTEVTSGAVQISDGAQNLAQGSTEQAATVEELSASIQDVAAKTKENSAMANNASSLAIQMKHNAEKGSTQMEEMTRAVDEINLASQNISKVIKVIDDIAFQTNILALNAAVEAARAGEAGKGFAVVADEVRNLASKSAAAAKETGSLIENSMQKAELGARIASETSASLSDIVAGINESTTLVESIAASSEEQSMAIEQINEAIEQVSDVVQRNSATAEQSAASSEELNAQSAILSANVSKFTLK